MPFPLRWLPDGARFVLCRTGQKFRLLRREVVKGRLCYFVEKENDPRPLPAHLSTLHHSCHVKLILPS